MLHVQLIFRSIFVAEERSSGVPSIWISQSVPVSACVCGFCVSVVSAKLNICLQESMLLANAWFELKTWLKWHQKQRIQVIMISGPLPGCLGARGFHVEPLLFYCCAMGRSWGWLLIYLILIQAIPTRWKFCGNLISGKELNNGHFGCSKLW